MKDAKLYTVAGQKGIIMDQALNCGSKRGTSSMRVLSVEMTRIYIGRYVSMHKRY